MSENINTIKLKVSSILNVPFQTYDDEFSFIVNGEIYRTSRIVSDLLSQNICRAHINDPTNNVFTINTKYKGNFSRILDLIKFDQVEIPANELPFIFEVIEFLGIESFEGNPIFNLDQTKISIDNVFLLIRRKQLCEKTYSNNFTNEIDFISTNFIEIYEKRKDELQELPYYILEKVLQDPKLHIQTEDQLLKFINELYLKDNECSFLYDYVYFLNVSPQALNEFINIFDQTDMCRGTWLQIISRLKRTRVNYNEEQDEKFTNRYAREAINILPDDKDPFNGVFNYFLTNSSADIKDIIRITSSSCINNEERNRPQNVIIFDDYGKRFYSARENSSWICFDFNDYRIIPTNYTIRSINWPQNSCHPKNWVIECSNDNLNWEIIDEVRNSTYLNGSSRVHTYEIKENKNRDFRFVRLRSSGPNWHNNQFLAFEAFEIYGTIIPQDK